MNFVPVNQSVLLILALALILVVIVILYLKRATILDLLVEISIKGAKLHINIKPANTNSEPAKLDLNQKINTKKEETD